MNHYANSDEVRDYITSKYNDDYDDYDDEFSD